MNDRLWLEHKWRNRIHTAAILAGLGLLLAALGWMIGGQLGLIWILFLGGTIMVFGPRVSPLLILKVQRARPMPPHHFDDIYQYAAELSRRAGLSGLPKLFLIPTSGLNAFALELGKGQPAIAMTAGLLDHLTRRELVGVLAHEISHLRHKDTKVMHLAGVMNHLVSTFAGMGRILLLLSIPLFLLTGTLLNWFPLLLMALSPIPSQILQMALSRTREFDADLGAAELTGDPHGLASALTKLDRFEENIFQRLFFPNHKPNDWLRTHPPSNERIRRLRNLSLNPEFYQNHSAMQAGRGFRPSHPSYPFGNFGSFLL